nr:MAG TPA: hypothetical protein [Caudoviricetes sp.]
MYTCVYSCVHVGILWCTHVYTFHPYIIGKTKYCEIRKRKDLSTENETS